MDGKENYEKSFSDGCVDGSVVGLRAEGYEQRACYAGGVDERDDLDQ